MKGKLDKTGALKRKKKTKTTAGNCEIFPYRKPVSVQSHGSLIVYVISFLSKSSYLVGIIFNPTELSKFFVHLHNTEEFYLKNLS